MARSYNEEATINSVIGENTRFEGRLFLQGLVRIDGDFSGELYTSGNVFISQNGKVQGTIKAGSITIGGIFKGDITVARSMRVLSTGIVLGSIRTPRLVAEDGVIFHGHCGIASRMEDDALDVWLEEEYNKSRGTVQYHEIPSGM